MRALFKVSIAIAILVVLAIGLLPPRFDQGSLDTEAVYAARAGSAALVGANSSDVTVAQAAASNSISGDPGVRLTNVSVDGQTVSVTLTQSVHTFMDGLPGLSKWFKLTSTQESTLGQ